uniref:Caspase-8 n=1 Tax=Laodelphax striatellus TaxID=195883 RepID=A0A3Q9HGP0_LAOST|nr:caspase-8 [Laodelphax striatellus]
MDSYNRIEERNQKDLCAKLLQKYHNGEAESYGSVLFSQEKLAANINLDVIELLEKDMDYNDIVSLMFLVSEDKHSQYIFQRIIQFLKIKSENLESVNYSLISDWCLSNPKNWRLKIIEGLGIIECFNILSRLGYKKIDIVEYFQLDNTEFSVCVSLLKKELFIALSNSSVPKIVSLYKCLEEVDNYSTELLLQDSFTNNRKYFEFMLIYLSSESLIRFEEQPDLKFLINLLERANLLDLKEILESYVMKYNAKHSSSEHPKDVAFKSKVPPDYDKPYTKDSSRMNQVKEEDFELENTERLALAYDDSELNYYKIGNPEDLGICLIINQKNFIRLRERDPKFHRILSRNLLVDRHGTERDVERLQETFNHFKVSVIVENDVPHSMIGNCIKDTIDREFKQHHSVFFLVILSHGDQGVIYGVNSIPVKINSLVDAVLRSYAKLKNIPKVIIVQACQGNLPNPVLETDGGSCGEAIPTQPKYSDIDSNKKETNNEKTRTAYHDDLLMCFSTVSGYESYRHTREGSKYIQILCDNLMKYGPNDDFLSICTRVNNDLKKLYVPIKINESVLLPSTQVSETSSCLHKKLFLVEPWRAIPTCIDKQKT